MKRAWIWILVGLVVFAGIYAFVFPQSQMPVRISLQKLDVRYIPKSDEFYVDNEKLITSKGETILLPEPYGQLPEGLSWDMPIIDGYEEKDGKIYVSFNGNAYVWDGAWQATDYKPKPHNDYVQKDYSTFNFIGIENATLKLESADGEKLGFNLDKIGAVADFSPVTNAGRIKGVNVNGNLFFPTDPTDGRIEKVVDGKLVAKLDRSRFDPQAVPLFVASDGKSVFTSVWYIGSQEKPMSSIQVYDLDLKYMTEFGDYRFGKRIRGFGYFNSMILTLWDDGLLEGFSTSGFLMFSQKIADECTGMMVAGDKVFVKGNTWVGLLDITVVKPETPVWPRILDIGLINRETTQTVTIIAKSEPTVQIKGTNVTIIGNSKLGDTWRIQLLANPVGLRAFENHSCELIVEMGKVHEIVPITFTPYEKARRFYWIGGFAIDAVSGERLDSKAIDKLPGKKIENRFSREIIMLSPEPGATIVK